MSVALKQGVFRGTGRPLTNESVCTKCLVVQIAGSSVQGIVTKQKYELFVSLKSSPKPGMLILLIL